MIAAVIIFIRANRWAQIALAAVVLGIAFTAWLTLHDRNVSAGERARIEQATIKRAEKATVKADARAETRQETINATLDDLRNSSSTDDWFERMRARQDAATAPGK